MAYVKPNLRICRSTLNPAAKVFEPNNNNNNNNNNKDDSNRKVANVRPNQRKQFSSLNPFAKVFVYKFKEEAASAACPANYSNQGARENGVGDRESRLVYYQPAPHIYPIINGHIVKLVDRQTGAPLVGTNDTASTPLLVYPQDSNYQYDENQQTLQQYAFETIPYRPPPYISFYPLKLPMQQQQQQQPVPQTFQQSPPPPPPPPQQQQPPKNPNRRSRNKRNRKSQRNNTNQREKKMTPAAAFETIVGGPSVYQSLLRLIADIKRPISYIEIIDALAERLQRTQIEMKRMVPAALHQAIVMGYLRKVDNNSFLAHTEDEPPSGGEK